MAIVRSTPGRFVEITSTGNFALATRAIARANGVGSGSFSKVGSVPDADGLIRYPQNGSGSEAQTVLSFAAKISDLADSALQLVPVSGTYDFRLDSLPSWMGFSGDQKGATVAQGVIAKGVPGEKVNKIAWDHLNNLYPDFF